MTKEASLTKSSGTTKKAIITDEGPCHSMQSINDLSSYEINQADRWEPLKSLIIGPGALLEKALTTPTASP